MNCIFVVIFLGMTNFSMNFHRYFGLLFPRCIFITISQGGGGGLFFIGKIDIGKHALFMMQKIEKRFE